MSHSRTAALARTLHVALMSILATRSLLAQSTSIRDSASDQTRAVVGRVVDEASRPLPGAEVRAADTRAMTDSAGHFVLRDLPNGEVQLVVRKVGYDSTSVTVAATAMVKAQDAAAPEISVILRRAQRLNEIVVEGQAYDRALWDRGFYHRQKLASGMFFDPDAIAHFGGDGLGSLVRQVPRVDVQHLGDSDYAFSRVGGRPCRMNIYIDGMFQRVAMPSPVAGRGGRKEEGIGLNELIDLHTVAAVEVYPRASSVPTQFMRMGPPAGPQGMTSQQIGSPNGLSRTPTQYENSDAACGAIVIWTRPPAQPAAATGGP